ncbi:MAG: hypothetical protein RL226_1597 [Bacteroidota bacterium]
MSGILPNFAANFDSITQLNSKKLKKIGFFFSALAAMALIACGGSGDSPEAAAQAYYDALLAKDMEKAKNYVTEETKPMMDLLGSMLSLAGDEMPTSAVCKECKVEGENAICTMETSKDGETATEELNLKNVEGKWLVHMPKEDGMGDMSEGDMMDMEAEDLSMEVDSLGNPINGLDSEATEMMEEAVEQQ